MATYTDNYTMTKPTYAEQADISVINANMDIIDNVMHSSQISLAPAYDINETYNTGDIVMHELLMYKCLEDNVTGVWDSTKWTRTTAGEESGGGADLDIYGEASGTAEASFSDGAEASLVKCIVEIEATQSGSGTPSPSNIRPISGHTDVTVTVASTSGGSGEDTTVSLGRTVYGGTLDVTTGVLTVTHGIVDLGTLNFTKTTQYGYTYFTGSPITNKKFNSICSDYVAVKKARNTLSNGEIGTHNTTNSFEPCIRDDTKADLTDEQFKTAMNGVQLVYELETPIEVQLTPTQVLTLLGQNYVSHDGGGTISLVYVKGDAPIKPNPADAEIPLTGLEIDGEKFKIESGGYQIDTLLNETNGVTVGVTYGFLDGHTLSEYDEIELIIATKENISGNLGYDRWVMSVQGLLDFPVINYGAYGQRWFHATFTNNSFIQNNTSGDQYPYVYRIYGIKH